MKHIKPTAKGDPLCPLGFHPQVRWPTRCKRCFRDYKEHGNRNKQSDSILRRDDTTASSPSLSNWASPLKSVNSRLSIPETTAKSWTSSSNLNSTDSESKTSNDSTLRFSKSSSWMSTPDLASNSENKDISSSSVTLLRRRRPEPSDTGQDDSDYKSTQFVVRRRTSSNGILNATDSDSVTLPITTTTSSLRTRSTFNNSSTIPTVSLLRSRASSARSSVEKSSSPDVDVTIRLKAPKLSNEVSKSITSNSVEKSSNSSSSSTTEFTSSDDDDTDTASFAGTETTDTTIVNDTDYQEQMFSLKKELEALKVRCEKAEREKNDLLLKRLAAMDTSTSKTTASELLKLQQKVNELKTTVEDLQDEKKVYSTRCKELECEIEALKKKGNLEKETEILRNKLIAAESLCEELMDENEDMKRELREMEDEMDEMQDHFREDQADEYSSLKKELEQTAKNCRILSFKLRKTERKAEQLEAEKLEAEKKYREVAGGQGGLDKVDKIKKLEKDLSLSNEIVNRLQKELDEASMKLKDISSEKGAEVKKKPPTLSSLNKNSSGEKISRESLTRGGSQDDPVQLLRDLQDSLEREADLREQLRYAEEEANNLRKKVSRVEDDNESLALQLKKMATKARTRRHSPNSQSRLTAESPNEKDEGISDEEDPAELRLLLELNEQETAVLRRKVEELESEGDGMKKKIMDLQEKLVSKSNSQKKEKKTAGLKSSEPENVNSLYETKLKVLEEDVTELRKKLIEKERDCERLHSELALTKKKPKMLQKSISLDGGSESIDLKRQLQVVEQEASILRTKNQSLELDNEKLLAENKKLTLSKGTKKGALVNVSQFELKGKIASLEKELEDANKKILQLEEEKNKNPDLNGPSQIDKMKAQISKLESEKSILRRLKEEPVTDSVKLYLKRTPKKPSDVTSKAQLKKMVEDLENEIGEVLLILQKSDVATTKSLESGKNDSEKSQLKNEVNELKKKLESTQKEFLEQRKKEEREKEKQVSERKKIENEKKKVEELYEKDKKRLESDLQNIETAVKKLEAEKMEQSTQISKLTSEIKKLNSSTSEKDKECEELKKKLESEKKLIESLRTNLDNLRTVEEDNIKLKKEVSEKSNKFSDIESKFKELEDKNRKAEKLISAKKDKILKLEKQLEEADITTKALESSQKKMLEKLQEEKETVLKNLEKLEAENQTLAVKLSSKEEEVLRLEKVLKEEKEKLIISSKTDSSINLELKKTREELSSLKKQNIDLNLKLKEAECSKRTIEDLVKFKEKEMRREVSQWELKASELEMDLQAERKMKERMKAAHEKESKNKEAEISNLQNKLSQQGLNRRLSEVRLEFDKQVEKLEEDLSKERKEYEELTTKYELLEKELVSIKSQYVMEKETLERQLTSNAEELAKVEHELRTLRDTYCTKQDSWIKEKLDLQERLKSLEKANGKANESEILQIQLSTISATLNEKMSEIEQLQRESSMQLNQLEGVKKENEDLRKKLDDYVKVSKVQRNMSADSSALDRELKEAKNRLYMEERARKADLSALKLRYDSRISIIMEELKSTQSQLTRFKRESDNYRHMFESAQKTIMDLKSSTKHSDAQLEQGETENQVVALEQQLSCVEDELSEARLECSRLKTELISNKSAFEVKVSEMASRINELEEERLISSGRTKIPGLKTKLELAWSKEREEQQRILQETSTLARDLRQTLFEMERERDKERLESKRKNELLRKTMDEEQEENKKKINELQCDLLELRDAHAKLRTTNEKLRREKEKFDQEKDRFRRMNSLFAEDPKLSRILDLCSELTVIIPELSNGKPNTTIGLVTPPVRRKGPKSRESSPAFEKSDHYRESSVAKDDPKFSRVQTIMQQLSDITQDLRRSQRMNEDDRRALFARRSASTESENPVDVSIPRKGLQRRSSLYRKSLSLEHTSPLVISADQNIWKMEEDDGSLTSFQSLDETPESKFSVYQRIDPNLDSRLSGDSTQSDYQPSGDKKKKKGLFGKLRKLTKSSSVDNDPEYEISSRSQLNPGSDTSLASQGNPESDPHSGKRNFKHRISDLFKKSGSTSRGNSMERGIGLPPSGSSVMSDSSHRPLIRTSPSPARSDVSSSSASRPLIGANGKRMVAPGSVPLPRKSTKK